MAELAGVPGYWMNETSGALRPIVTRYLEGRDLNLAELELMRAYLRQWIEAPGFVGPAVEQLRAELELVTSNAALRRWLADAFNAGVDPL